MREDDKQPFTALLKATLAMYGQEASVGVTTIWWEALARFEFQEVRGAFSRYITNVDTGQYAPRPADIIRILEGGATEGRALAAWSNVLDSVRLVGSWRSVVFDDPLIHAVIEAMGGWITLCGMSTDDVPFRGQEFQKRYRAMIHSPPDSYPPKLLGMAEAHNMMNGHESEPPTLIGDPKKCEAVLVGGSSMPRLQMQQAGEVARAALPGKAD